MLFIKIFIATGEWQSGQMQGTVNPPTRVYVGSNPTFPKFKVLNQLFDVCDLLREVSTCNILNVF